MRNTLVGENLQLVYQRLFTIRDLRRDRQREDSHSDRLSDVVEKSCTDIVKPSAMARRNVDELEHAKNVAMSPGVHVIAFEDRKELREIRKCEPGMILD